MKRARKPIESSKPLEYVRVFLFFLGCLLAIVGVILAPKELVSGTQLYSSAVSMAHTEDNYLVLYEYKVYGTEARMQKALETEVPAHIQLFKSNADVLVVKIPGEARKVQTYQDYVCIEDPSVPELNIEFCIAKNVDFFGYSLPTRTFIRLADDLLGKARILYLCLVVLIAFLVLTPCSIFGTKALLRLIKLYQKKDEPTQEASE